MKPLIYCIVAVPCGGKSYVAEQVKHLFEYVHHDGFIYLKTGEGPYVEAIVKAAQSATKPLLIEAPFSMSKIIDPLIAAGYPVTPVFIQEKPEILKARYEKREGKDKATKHLAGHLTRQRTFGERARLLHAFQGTSDQVLEHLKGLAKAWTPA